MVKEILDGADEADKTFEWCRRGLNHHLALDFVDLVMEGGFSGLVEKPWFPFLYRHRLEFDIRVLNDRPPGEAIWCFNNFRPKSTWFISALEQFVVVRFRNEEDLLLFKLSVT